MKQVSTRVLSLVICLMMLVGMITTVTVSAASSQTTVLTWAEAASDVSKFTAAADVAASWDTTTFKDGTGAVKFALTPATAVWSYKEFARATGVTWKKGFTYTVSFDVYSPALSNQKTNIMARFNSNSGTMTTSTNGTVNAYNVADAQVNQGTWTTITKTFTVDNLSGGVESVGGYIQFDSQQHANGITYYIDNFTVIETYIEKYDVAIAVGEHGTVQKNGEAVADGTVLTVEEESDLTLTLTPNENYEPRVTVNGQVVAVTNNTVTIENITADTAVSVIFLKRTTVLSWADAASDASQFTALKNDTTISWDGSAGVNGTGAVKISQTPADPIWAWTPFAKLTGVTWKKGATYTISFDVNFNATTAYMIRFNPVSGTMTSSVNGVTNPYGAAFQKSGTNGWDTYTYTFTVDDISGGAASVAGYFQFESVQYVNGRNFIIDNLTVVEAMDVETANSTYYVSPTGSDSNDGSLEQPFKTIQKARDTISAADELPEGGVTVNIMGGSYPVSQTIAFTEAHSGTADKPIVYQAYNNEKVVFEGGKVLDTSKVERVTDTALLNRLIDEKAKSKLMMLDLGEQNVTMTPLAAYGWQTDYYPKRIYMNNTVLINARWPNDDLSMNLTSAAPYTNVDYTQYNDTGLPIKMTYTDLENRSSRWTITSGDAYIGGAITQFWNTTHLRIDNIDATNKIVTTLDNSPLSLKNTGWGPQHKVYFSNIFEEIDQPGESYVDRTNNILYFYPVGDIADVNNSEMIVSNMDQFMLTATDLSYVTFRGIDFKNTIQTPVKLIHCNHVKVENAEISNSTNQALVMDNCTNTTITGCHFYNTGRNFLEITNSGDRTSLTPSGNVISNNHFHNNTQLPTFHGTRCAVFLGSCVGDKIHNNKFSDFPQTGISMLNCNDVLIEYNEFKNGVQFSSDAGAVYWVGDMDQLGTVIRYNYFENMGNSTINGRLQAGGARSVFWDDSSTGPNIYGNVFFNAGYDSAAMITNGGEFSNVHGNVVITTEPDRLNSAIDIRGWLNDIGVPGIATDSSIPTSSYLYLTGLRTMFHPNTVEFESGIKDLMWSDTWATHYAGTQWEAALERYSQEMYEGAKVYYDAYFAADATAAQKAQAKEDMGEYLKANLPVTPSNVVHNNVVLGNTIIEEVGSTASQNYVGTHGTITAAEKALFVDFDIKDFTLTSAGLATIQAVAPQFEAIPFGNIGLIEDASGNVPGGSAPVVTINNNQLPAQIMAGEEVTAVYTYADSDNDAEGITKIYWYVGDTATGDFEMIEGVQGKYFTPSEEYAGRYVKYEVVPYDVNVLRGEEAMSVAIPVVAMIDVTVSVGENGTVANGDETVTNGTVISLLSGSDLTLTLTPAAGYEATVTVNGQEVTVTNNTVTIEDVVADTQVSVTFAIPTVETVVFAWNDAETIVNLFTPHASTTASWVADGGKDNTGAVKFDYAAAHTATGSWKEIFKVNNLTWKKGATYTISMDVKTAASSAQILRVGVNSGTWTTHATTPGDLPYGPNHQENTSSGAWKTYTTTFTVDGFSSNAEQAAGRISFDTGYFGSGAYWIIDNLTIVESMPVSAGN